MMSTSSTLKNCRRDKESEEENRNEVKEFKEQINDSKSI